MSSKPCLLLTLFHIYRQSNCLTTYCSQNEGQTCKFNCTTEQTMDWCSYGILICRDNEACIITCDGYQKCQNTQITCPANADCKLKCISGGNVCEDIAITTNNATSFQCVGSECPSNIPAQYSPNPTRNPTPYPSKSPTTLSPTPLPTQSTPNPTKSPSKPPTYNPSKSPTYNPSTSPSTEPTDFHSKSPTNTPTMPPTKSPITPSPTRVIPVTPSPVNPDIISTTITASTTAVPVPHKSDDIAEKGLVPQEILVIVSIAFVLSCALILVVFLWRKKWLNARLEYTNYNDNRQPLLTVSNVKKTNVRYNDNDIIQSINTVSGFSTNDIDHNITPSEPNLSNVKSIELIEGKQNDAKEGHIEENIARNGQYNECVVCMDKMPHYACIPCGHHCLCLNCKDLINNQCPICLTQCTVVKIFK